MKKPARPTSESLKAPKARGKKQTAQSDRAQEAVREWQPNGIDLDNYAPAYFTFITNKWASESSSVYREYFDVGIEIWRVLVMLAIDEKVSISMVCKLVGMDKGSVSRCFKTMYEKGLVTFSHDPHDGRVRYATLTEAGWRKHDEIKGLALARQQALLSCLSPQESEVLIDMLRRIHVNLPNAEKVTQQYLQDHVIKPKGKK